MRKKENIKERINKALQAFKTCGAYTLSSDTYKCAQRALKCEIELF